MRTTIWEESPTNRGGEDFRVSRHSRVSNFSLSRESTMTTSESKRTRARDQLCGHNRSRQENCNRPKRAWSGRVQRTRWPGWGAVTPPPVRNVASLSKRTNGQKKEGQQGRGKTHPHLKRLLQNRYGTSTTIPPSSRPGAYLTKRCVIYT